MGGRVMRKRITKVEPLESFRLRVIFEDDAVKIFDVVPYLDTTFFNRLREEEYFNQVEIGDYGDSVRWDDGQDFSADMLYARGESV